MFKSHIKLAVLKKIGEKPCSGYDLMSEIEKITGKKPSPGYIYPLLKDLKEKKLIKETKKSNKNIYNLTSQGKKLLKDLMKHTQHTSEVMLKTFEPITNKGEMKTYHRMQKIFMKKSSALMMDMDVWQELKREVFRIANKDYEKNANRCYFTFSYT